jgi:hypothetical protein
MRSFGLRPQDDRERLNDKHQIKGNLTCHSAAGEESHVFVEFLTRRIISDIGGKTLQIPSSEEKAEEFLRKKRRT